MSAGVGLGWGDTVLSLVLFDWPFQGCGGACGLCLGSGARCACDSSSGVWPAGGLQWCFACGPGGERGWGALLVVAVAVGSFWSGMAFSGMWGDLWAVSKVESSVRAPCLPRFILLESFSDTLLVVSVLDIVYSCHL